MKETYLNLCYVLILQNIPFSFGATTGSQHWRNGSNKTMKNG